MAVVEKFNCSYLLFIVYSVRFVVPGAMDLVIARNTVMEKVIGSVAHGAMEQEEECKYWICDVLERSLRSALLGSRWFSGLSSHKPLRP